MNKSVPDLATESMTRSVFGSQEVTWLVVPVPMLNDAPRLRVTGAFVPSLALVNSPTAYSVVPSISRSSTPAESNVPPPETAPLNGVSAPVVELNAASCPREVAFAWEKSPPATTNPFPTASARTSELVEGAQAGSSVWSARTWARSVRDTPPTDL